MNKKLWMILLFSVVTLYTMHKQYQSFTNSGCVILINGTPSAGKSTICKHLLKLIKDRKIISLSLDVDILPEIAFEQALKLGLIHDQMSEEEIQKIIISNIDLIFQECVQTRWIEPNRRLFKKACEIAQAGNVVLLDTVIGICENGEDVASFQENLKNITTFKVLVYCSPEKLAQRIAARNSLNDPAEQRDPYNTMMEFCWMYKPANVGAQVIATITKSEMLKAMKLIQAQLLQSGMSVSEEIEKVQKLQNCFEQNFFDEKKEMSQIVSCMQHDLIVDASSLPSHQCAEVIYEALKLN